ncbi:MAG: ATP-binding protein [Acidobacteriia bacterium]|nr:ATP-binding protein [Terriglobia bacterium]
MRTEAEMAEEWWQSADGAKDGGHRDRARVLKALAEQALAQADHLSVTGMPASAVDALVASESLSDLGNDRVAFRHDVLREWAIGNLLYFDLSLIERLPLDRPAPPDLGRGVELAARLSIERTADIERWRSLHAAVSKTGVNESWRRAVLLALVRSEIAVEMLDKASAALFAVRARLLRELIRIVMAVESDPVDKYFAAAGIDPRKIPAGINVPVGPSWARLILWLIKTGVGVPAPAIPDVVSLYSNWSIIWGGKDPWTPRIVEWFYYWLSQIDTSRIMARSKNRPRAFNDELDSEQVGRLAEDLRTGFLLFCNHRPNLAAEYLKSFSKHPYRHHALRALLKFRGALAQAAPKELAELTADYLLPKEDKEDEEYSGPFPEAFKYVGLDFVPASPAQGPFYELLLHAPEYGLPLIRRIVDHAVAFKTGGRDFFRNAMTVVFPDGCEKVFPWYQSYGWSRDLGAGPSVVASALLALEAWAHGRIEKGEPVDKVVAEIIGQGPVPAAYLLVAVDLLLSHWPDSHTPAVPFVACPELLCLDRQRVVSDNIQMPDIFGLKEVEREPAGLVSLESLKTRPSRHLTLDQLLDFYAMEEFSADRPVLTGLLQGAAARLGPPQKQSNLGDPELMVLHALNRIDPNNWRKTSVQTADGPKEGWEYTPPAAERDHLKPLQDEMQERNTHAQAEGSIRIVLNNPGRSSTVFAAAAVKWAREVANKPAGNGSEQWLREEAIVSVAMIAARDGGTGLIATHGDWVRETFRRAFKGKHDPACRMRDGLQYNPIAIAFMGTALLLKNRFEMADVRTLLEAAGDDDPAAAQGFFYVAGILAAVDERLPRAVLRCAFLACIQPVRQWGMPEEDHKARLEARHRAVTAAIEADLAWLDGKLDEPAWPAFEPSRAHSRHSYSLNERRRERDDREKRPEQYTDQQAAALWLGKAASIFDVVKRPWLRDVARAYSNWTVVANGSDLGEEDDPDRIPDEWNRAYFNLLARCLAGLTIPQIDEFALGPILRLPGEASLDVTAIFVRSVDDVYFNGTGLGDGEAVHIRTTLARRLMTSRQWEWQRRDLSDSIGTHLARALAVLLFNDYSYVFSPSKCYLLERGVDRLPPFLPPLQELAESGPFLFMATTLLNLLEVSPRPAHLPLTCAASKSWLAAHADDSEFWIGRAIGRRVCSVIEATLTLAPNSFAPDQPGRREIDDVLGKWIRLGVAEAHRLEKALREIQ